MDHTTDVRRGKLKLYEARGFPEVWVEVPERRALSRPSGILPGLTIHLLEGGAYRESRESRAFPDWRAEAIHEAMNEVEPSAWTHARLERLGRVLGERDGTGPDDDPLLRSLRDQSRVESRREMVRQILWSRGIPVSAGFPGGAPALAESREDALVAAALACGSEHDFLAHVARAGNR